MPVVGEGTETDAFLGTMDKDSLITQLYFPAMQSSVKRPLKRQRLANSGTTTGVCGKAVAACCFVDSINVCICEGYAG